MPADYVKYTVPFKQGVSYNQAIGDIVQLVDGVKCATYLGVCSNLEDLISAISKCKTVEQATKVATKFKGEYLKLADKYRTERVIEIYNIGKDGRKENG